MPCDTAEQESESTTMGNWLGGVGLESSAQETGTENQEFRATGPSGKTLTQNCLNAQGGSHASVTAVNVCHE